MRKDPTEFRARFKAYKEGKMPYENGLPKYEDGKTPKDKRARALYNAIDPRDAYPESYIDAARKEIKIRHKMYFGDPDKLEYELGEDLPSRVSDAAWRKRLGYDYDNTLLIPNGTSFRLPKELEQEIPTDTTMLKDRINRTKELMQYSRKYRSNKYIKEALQRDQEALDALRYTYSTGMPATINEHAYNSRQWVSGGEVSPTMSPLNVLQNYTIQYNKKDNTMKYRDVYDFNQFDWAIPGTPFTIEGILNLPKYSNGKSPIHIKPANRGKFTALKKRTGHSTSWFKENGTPAQKKMAVFAMNAKKWKH